MCLPSCSNPSSSSSTLYHHHSCMVGRSAAPFSAAAAAAAAAAKPGRHLGKGRGRGRRGTSARRHWESGIGGGGGGGDWRRRERGFFPTSALPYLDPHFPATDGAEFHLLSGFSGCQTGLPAGRRFKNVLFGGRRLASFHKRLHALLDMVQLHLCTYSSEELD